ncbi:MAG TPA: hypothetical protein VII05_04310 [Gaiellaceae bacterium]
MDQTGSEKSNQPVEASGNPPEPSIDEQRAANRQAGETAGASRAFDLLERFSGELEEILHSLERAKGGSVEERPQAPERAYRPSSIHFDSSPISERIDPYGLPPVQAPGTISRTGLRILLEALFLVLVAAIAAKTNLRPLFIVAAEAAALLIAISIEVTVSREKRRYQQFASATPSFTAPAPPETEPASAAPSVTPDQVEPLVWRPFEQEGAEPEWPLAAGGPAFEAESDEQAPEGVTEISTTPPEAEIASESALDTRAGEDLEGAVVTPVAEPEVEPEVASEPSAEIPGSYAEPEVELESAPEIGAEEVAEAAAEVELERREEIPSIEDEAKSAHDAVVAEEKPEAEVESAPEMFAPEDEPERRHRFRVFRREEREELETELGSEPESALESTAEIPAEEVEPERHGLFHFFGRAEQEFEPELADEVDAEIDSVADEPVGASFAEIEPEPDVELERALEVSAPEEEPERRHRFRLFQREEREEHEAELESGPEAWEEVRGAELEIVADIVAAETTPEADTEAVAPEPEVEEMPEAETETAPEVEAAPGAEVSALEAEPESHGLSELFGRKAKEIEREDEAEVKSTTELFAVEEELELPRRFHLFRHEERVREAETKDEPVVESAREAELEPNAEVEVESAPAVFATEEKSEHRRRLHLFRHEETEPSAADEPAGDASVPRPAVEPVEFFEAFEATVEVELPPEIELDRIERTLEDVRREPPARRRRWSRASSSEKEAIFEAHEYEPSNGESELRLTAEQERRRREREYLRDLRVSR